MIHGNHSGHAVDVGLDAALAARVGAEPQVLGHRQLGERPAPLRHVRDPGPRDRLGPAA